MGALRITIATDRRIESWSRGALANVWDDQDQRLIEADLHDPEVFAYDSAFGHIDLIKPVLHPWFAELAGRCLGITETEARDVVLGGRAGWTEDGRFVTGAEAAVYPLLHGGAELAQRLEQITLGESLAGFFRAWQRTPRQLLLERLPILPPVVRRRFPGIERLYRNVIASAHAVAVYAKDDVPQLLWEHQLFELQAAVDLLFDNRTADRPGAGLDGRILPSLGDVVDGSRRTDHLRLALRGAALDAQE